jgi:hypothetical protein
MQGPDLIFSVWFNQNDRLAANKTRFDRASGIVGKRQWHPFATAHNASP